MGAYVLALVGVFMLAKETRGRPLEDIEASNDGIADWRILFGFGVFKAKRVKRGVFRGLIFHRMVLGIVLGMRGLGKFGVR